MAHVWVAVLIGILFFAIAVGLAVRGFILDQKVQRLTSECLGIKIVTKTTRFLPEDNMRYEAWCRDNNIVPYAAMTSNEKWQTELDHDQTHSLLHKPEGATATSRSGGASSQPTATTPAEFAKPTAPSPPAWHPDPTGRFPQRYFDGTYWTAWVIDQKGVEITDPGGAPQ